MKHVLTLVTLPLTASAILVGQLTATAGGRGGGDGGVADAGVDCASAPNAIVGNNPFNTTGATVTMNYVDTICGTYNSYNCKFFTFTATLAGAHTFSTCGGSTWDTRLEIMTDCGPVWNVIGCNDDACEYQSTMAAALSAGVTYKISIGGYGGGDMGPGTLIITEPTGGGGTGEPDVIVGSLPEVSKWGSAVVNGQTIMAYSFGTTSCNIGTGQLSWYASPDNRHPFIPMNMYRFKGKRVEQIGMSWGKHGFCALQDTLCGPCIPAGGGCPPILGIGCSDPYGSDLNGGQSGLGTRKEVNASTGAFPGNFNSGMPGAAATIGRRMQVNANDLNPAMNAGALYLAEGQYIHPEDAANGLDNNNASWRSLTVGTLTAGAYNLTLTGATNQQIPGISAWRAFDPSVTLVNIDVENDGRFIVGYQVQSNGNGTWRYEYAIQNLNSDRSGRSLSIPVPAGVTITNAGFKDINYHSGDPYDATDWTIATSGGAITWTGGTFATNVNGNALRFATLYNFWFDANQPPAATTATLGLFKPGIAGAPASVSIALQGPAAIATNPADINGDGVVNAADLSALLGNWGGTGATDINNDGVTNATDLALLLAAWGA